MAPSSPSYLTYLASGAYDCEMQIGIIHVHPHYADWQPPQLLYTCSLCFVDSCPSSHPSLTHFKENPPIPLKVPFSLVLMADRLWPHSHSAAACPHCVPLLGSSVWVEDRLAPPKSEPDMDVWAGGASSHWAWLSSTCNSQQQYASSSEEGRGGGCRLRVLVALGCLFNSWGS